MNKTFSDLIQEVQEPGKCHRCGGCVTFCSSSNLGALELDGSGRPRFNQTQECLECGLCYMICPETWDLDLAIKERAGWQAPFGRQIGLSIARASDEQIRERGTDGGVVTAILLHLFDTGRINGAIVSKATDAGRTPFLATTREDLVASAGSCFRASYGMAGLADAYSTYSASLELLTKKLDILSEDSRLSPEEVEGLPPRLAFVGTPCQVNTFRKMQALEIVPSDTVAYCFGLFCAGNFDFDARVFKEIEDKYSFRYADVEKINIKEEFLFTLNSGRTVAVGLDDLERVKRGACRFCTDFGAEYADIAFGGLGAEQGWTTVLPRTDIGRGVLDTAMENVLIRWPYAHGEKAISWAQEKLEAACIQKQQQAIGHGGRFRLGEVRIV